MNPDPSNRGLVRFICGLYFGKFKIVHQSDDCIFKLSRKCVIYLMSSCVRGFNIKFIHRKSLMSPRIKWRVRHNLWSVATAKQTFSHEMFWRYAILWYISWQGRIHISAWHVSLTAITRLLNRKDAMQLRCFNSFEDRLPIDSTNGWQVFIWVAETREE